MQLRRERVEWRALPWTVVEFVEEILASWRALAARAPDQPFQHPSWIGGWLAIMGRELAVRPRIVVGHHGGRCELVVPLGITGGIAQRAALAGGRFQRLQCAAYLARAQGGLPPG